MLFDVAIGLWLAAVSPAKSNSRKLRASPQAVGVRVSTLNFDCCGDMLRTLWLRSWAICPADPARTPCSGMLFSWPVMPALVLFSLPFGLPPLIQYTVIMRI